MIYEGFLDISTLLFRYGLADFPENLAVFEMYLFKKGLKAIDKECMIHIVTFNVIKYYINSYVFGGYYYVLNFDK